MSSSSKKIFNYFVGLQFENGFLHKVIREFEIMIVKFLPQKKKVFFR